MERPSPDPHPAQLGTLSAAPEPPLDPTVCSVGISYPTWQTGAVRTKPTLLPQLGDDPTGLSPSILTSPTVHSSNSVFFSISCTHKVLLWKVPPGVPAALCEVMMSGCPVSTPLPTYRTSPQLPPTVILQKSAQLPSFGGFSSTLKDFQRPAEVWALFALQQRVETARTAGCSGLGAAL